MSMTITTPSSGKREGVHFNMNRLRIEPTQRVVYWSERDQAVKVDTVDAFHGMSGNWFTIDGQIVFVSDIHARLPGDRDEEAIVADFTAFGRRILTPHERAALGRKHRLDA